MYVGRCRTGTWPAGRSRLGIQIQARGWAGGVCKVCMDGWVVGHVTAWHSLLGGFRYACRGQCRVGTYLLLAHGGIFLGGAANSYVGTDGGGDERHMYVSTT